MMALKATWDKVPSGPGKKSEPVDVIVLGFGQMSSGGGPETRPVAIVQDLSDGNKLRYAELKYVSIKENQ